MSHKMTRRGLIAGSIAGAAGFVGFEERILLAAMQQGADPNAAKPPAAKAADMPTGKIGKFTISRLILGGNLIGGWAHSRDLMYVSKLFKAYNTKEKIYETLALAEQHGINSILISEDQMDIISKYKKDTGGKIQMIIDFRPNENNPTAKVDKVIDAGAEMIYLHGASCDNCVKRSQVDVMQKALAYIKEKGVPAGIGAHSYYVLEQCRDVKIEPDFWVKTFHHDKYWSAHPKDKREPFSVDNKQSDNHDEIHDNMFCLEPQETIDFFKKDEKPWIAFKTLAAGAIPPPSGFKYAFENGADFITVGMFDFQIAEDVALARSVIDKAKDRERPWRA
jgi:hypothetical protein